MQFFSAKDVIVPKSCDLQVKHESLCGAKTALKPIKSLSDDLYINVQMLPICWENLQERPGEILQSWMCQAICDESKKTP